MRALEGRKSTRRPPRVPPARRSEREHGGAREHRPRGEARGDVHRRRFGRKPARLPIPGSEPVLAKPLSVVVVDERLEVVVVSVRAKQRPRRLRATLRHEQPVRVQEPPQGQAGAVAVGQRHDARAVRRVRARPLEPVQLARRRRDAEAPSLHAREVYVREGAVAVDVVRVKHVGERASAPRGQLGGVEAGRAGRVARRLRSEQGRRGENRPPSRQPHGFQRVETRARAALHARLDLAPRVHQREQRGLHVDVVVAAAVAAVRVVRSPRRGGFRIRF
mmetsp:Transcript_666/g.2481  ORF Transcript_666/g.2481 Transcript_666/m.2481 type:complete len:277 (-) Transcript_666:788-1618(-)